MTSFLNLSTFEFPHSLEPDLVQFYLRQPSFALQDLGTHVEELSRYVGVYFLFYTGSNELYREIVAMNVDGLIKPIYVGKAVAAGSRSGNSAKITGGLFHRLNLHRTSLEEAAGLDVADFQVRVIAMEGAAAVQWAEQTFITRLQPAWNVAIAGFGIKVPGAGRNEQKISVWDTLHPGRSLAKDLTKERDLGKETAAAVDKMRKKLAIDLSFETTDSPISTEAPEATPAPASETAGKEDERRG